MRRFAVVGNVGKSVYPLTVCMLFVVIIVLVEMTIGSILLWEGRGVNIAMKVYHSNSLNCPFSAI